MSVPTGARRVPSLSWPYWVASAATVALAGLASAVGLFVDGFYRDAPDLVVQALGQDLLTLAVAVPALAVALVAARRGSLQAYVLWLGVTAYLCYTYGVYAVMTAFNELYLVYVALFGLTAYTLAGGLLRLDPTVVRARLAAQSVTPYVVFEVAVAVLVGFLWLSEVVPATLSGSVPASAATFGLPVNPIHTFDLAVVLPAFLLAAYWLRTGRAWGYALTGVLLVKGLTLGLAILSMIAFMLQDGQPVPAPQVVVFAAITLAGLWLTARYVRGLGEAVETGAQAGGHGHVQP